MLVPLQEGSSGMLLTCIRRQHRRTLRVAWRGVAGVAMILVTVGIKSSLRDLYPL